MEIRTTRVFNNGNSQAVRIPAEFRLDTDQVQISRTASGDLVLHPLRPERGHALIETLEALGQVDPSFVEAISNDRADRLPIQERDPL